jgi:hypothetical protein
MRYSASIILLSAIFSAAAWAQTETEVPVVKSAPPTMTAVQPVNPVASKPGAPIIQSISAQIPSMAALVPAGLISAQFHFVAPNGNAAVLHREAETTGRNTADRSPNQAINTPADEQKKGAMVTSLWTCTDSRYAVAVRAYIMDTDGNRSNEVRYTVHCNGG